MNTSLITLSLLATTMLAAQAQTANVTIDVGSRGHDISPQMYGVFFEEINHAGDGGLYAEMLQNRGFEEQVVPRGCTYKDGYIHAPHQKCYLSDKFQDWSDKWDMEQKTMQGWQTQASGCRFSYKVETMAEPLNANTPNAMRLTISETTPTAKAELVNTGYWGVAAEQGATYRLRFFLRSSDYKNKVKAVIADDNGEEAAAKTFRVKSDGRWHEYKATLKSSKTFAKGTFRLLFTDGGTVDVDYVSLFPTDTYKGRDNGLRRDVAEKIEGLHPAFMRWPGGCIVEGAALANRVRWKETLGDPVQRLGEWSLWGYRSSWGLGYHEFLQMCEDMGMDGMYVANVGLGCAYRNGDYDEFSDSVAMKQYRQDISDAIEYALGDVSTEWGAKRAKAGHPKPFPLKYIELGNENYGQRYAERFSFFYEPLKQKWPQITFINNLSWTDADWCLPIIKKTDMFDPHWYVAPKYFYENSGLFDTAKRGDYKIYVGEYAANSDVGSGNMDAALSEACFMGGMERNGDLVRMASYAPLLTNENQPNWMCNLIHYDNHRTMGRASYYVQKLYAENRPDYAVAADLSLQQPDSTCRQQVFAGYDEKGGEIVLKVVNAKAEPLSVVTNLKGITDVQPTGRVITLKADRLTDENTLDNPEKIVPVETTYAAFAPTFNYTFPPNSLTILRIAVK